VYDKVSGEFLMSIERDYHFLLKFDIINTKVNVHMGEKQWF
jgi:hypothetical protein